jgi:hypothetical protein
MPDRSRCPKCGERVSPFAAGCAICGADLDTRRWDSGPGPLTRAGSWLAALGSGPRNTGPSGAAIVLLLLFGGTIVSLALYALGLLGL